MSGPRDGGLVLVGLECRGWSEDVEPVRDEGPAAGTFSRPDFTYDRKADTYTCPGGNTLVTRGTLGGGREIRYRTGK